MTGLRVAVVGAGPAGMYAIGHLLAQGAVDTRIDLYERLATPWGLVRSGVAPDHPEKKLIADRHFDFSLDDARVRFFGNVEIGETISHAVLVRHYHAVVYAVGAGADLRMNIPGEDLPGCFASRAFVSFYNGHPDFRHLDFDLSSERAVIVGNGNVALDLARILIAPVEELARTDITDRALDLLAKSAIREVVLLARRGPAEAACNNPELEEIGHLPADVIIRGAAIPPADRRMSWEVRRKLETLARLAGRSQTPGAKRVVFHFLASPLAIEGSDAVRGVRVAENALVASADGTWSAQPTGRATLIGTGLVFRAIGYRGTRFPGLPFDEATGTVPNVAGRVVADDGAPLPGAYVTGWIKRGCRGIIGTNRRCARETAETLLADLVAEGDLRPLPAPDAAAAVLAGRAAPIVSREGWRQIDRHEREAGRAALRPRVKTTEPESQLVLAAAARFGPEELVS